MFLGAALIIAGLIHGSVVLPILGVIVLAATGFGLHHNPGEEDNLRETASRNSHRL